MTTDTAPDPLAERRLALEESKARQDFELKKRELDLKERESGWWARLFSPLVASIILGALTLGGTVVANIMQAGSALSLEREKVKNTKELESQKQEHELVLKMVAVDNEERARKNLQFLAENKLVSDDLAKRLLASKQIAVVPPPSSQPRPLPLVHTEDDAIDVIMTAEGGFVDIGNYSFNFGVPLTLLRDYRGTSATVDDLKNLTKEEARKILKAHLEKTVPAFTTPLVRAAYYNLIYLSGNTSTTRAYREALGKVLQKEFAGSGSLTADEIAAVNSVPNPNLFVENVSCAWLATMKNIRTFPQLGPGWTKRIRAFSPAVLQGVCPDLLPPEPAAQQPGK